MDDWVLRLKAGYDAGYYTTEPAIDQQWSFPWQNKTCRDCPFWLNDICRVRASARAAEAHTCSYFDPANHTAARHILQERMREAQKRWWEWLHRRES